MIGKIFGRLKVTGQEGKTPGRHLLWKCVCECGGVTHAPKYALESGNTKSCGCLHIDAITTHGMSGGKSAKRRTEYTIWMNMLSRCRNPKCPDYKNYGGRGIKVCRRWEKFENFYADMGDRPKNLTLDRINNDGNYCRSNCRWADRRTQRLNSRR